VNTTFTNANGNLLWADSDNWSNGVPGASDTAVFGSALPGAVDLGGVLREALSPNFRARRIRRDARTGTRRACDEDNRA
jgi:hypothetical protein